jgi:putative hydrolases of HD superfamily
MYRMAMMTMSAPPSLTSRLDMNKCMRMCLVHDVAESLVGDITPVDGISKLEKNQRETAVTHYFAKKLLGNVPGTSGEDLAAIWQEYEDHKTPESKFVADLDKVELLLQMVEYEVRGEGKLNLSEFTYVATKVILPETKAWVEEILKERKDFWTGKGLVPEAEKTLATEVRAKQDEYYAEDT